LDTESTLPEQVEQQLNGRKVTINSP
jgi:hypothetical protein